MFTSDYFQIEKAFCVMLPGKIALTVLRIADFEHISPCEALGRFYASTVYRSLEDESTKCWWESPRELFHDYETLKSNPFEAYGGCLKSSDGIHRSPLQLGCSVRVV